MKILKLIFLIAMLFSVVLFAERIKVVTDCYSRISDSSLKSAGYVKAGAEFEVLEKTGAWHFVKFVAGTKHINKEGWIWRQLLDGNTVKGKGANIHKESATDSEIIFSVKGGAKIKLIKKDVKWYKVGPKKYIYYVNVKVIK